MALSLEEYQILFNDISRQALAQADDTSVDVRNVIARAESIGDPREATLFVLAQLVEVFSVEDPRVVDAVETRLQEYIRSEDGGLVSGVRVVLAPEQQETLGTEELNLRTSPARAALVADLRSLLNDLQNEGLDLP
jgi:hypothetical protein